MSETEAKEARRASLIEKSKARVAYFRAAAGMCWGAKTKRLCETLAEMYERWVSELEGVRIDAGDCADARVKRKGGS